MDRKLQTPERAMSLKELDELPLFFIIGRGRSGSTLLRSMLDSHPSVLIPLESRFVQLLYYSFPVKRAWSRDQAFRSVETLESGFEPLNLHRGSLLEEIDRHQSDLNFERVCKLIYLHTRSEFKKEKIRVLGDKNPRYTFFIPELMKIFPGAKFIHLIRDPLDNIVSVQRAGKLIQESDNPYFAMGRWCLYNRMVLKYEQRHPEYFHTVHFEELVKNPGLVMQRLCTFLNLEYDPDMLHYDEGIRNYFQEKHFKALHRSLQNPFDLSKIGEWERVMPQRVAMRCEVLGGRLPEEFGYSHRFEIHPLRKTFIWICCYPLIFLGQFRFRLKILFYRSRILMRMAYALLLKIR